MPYQSEWEAERDALLNAIAERDRWDRIGRFHQERMAAFAVLMAKDPATQERASGDLALLTARPGIADQIRLVLGTSNGALTIREIREGLRAAGVELNKQVNPASTIGSVCARFVEQGFAELHKKNGRKAWKRKT